MISILVILLKLLVVTCALCIATVVKYVTFDLSYKYQYSLSQIHISLPFEIRKYNQKQTILLVVKV